MAPTYQVEFDELSLLNQSAEDVFNQLVQAGNGGTRVRSTSAPALSTEFVKSKHSHKVQSNQAGAFSEIIYPSHAEIKSRSFKKHGADNVMGYDHTTSSDIFPGGYGERSARALAREENTYQLKGAFPSAMLNFSKLRARVEARGGDLKSIERVFARMWGLSEMEVESIPHLHVDGSEATRLAAMEDRAYHALSGHPGHHGGFRVDMATLAPDALGENVPLNWPRLRTSLKAVALSQTQGDEQINSLINLTQKMGPARFAMDIVAGSQPVYERPYPWENVVDRLMDLTKDSDYQVAMPNRDRDIGYAMSCTFQDAMVERILNSDDLRMKNNVSKIAKIVSESSTRSLLKTIDAMLEHDEDRAVIDVENEAEFDALDRSLISEQFVVPRYKVTRSSLAKGVKRVRSTPDKLPDIRTGGRLGLKLDLREFRESGLSMPLDVPGALNMAVYFAAMNPQARLATYNLINLVRPPPDDPNHPRKSAVRLRKESLYQDPNIRKLGSHIFTSSFRNTLELLLSNMVASEVMSEQSVKNAIWDYLSRRCKDRRLCPYHGGWRDLMIDIIEAPEGWSLFYWVRISAGRKHHSLSSGIMASISAGEVVDFLTLIRRNVKDRINHWATFYTSKYKSAESAIEDKRRRKMTKLGEPPDPVDDLSSSKYVPPHLRRMVDLENYYLDPGIQSKGSLESKGEYEYMVEMQSKSKFFKLIRVSTYGSKVTVGITDSGMREMLIEFYQARWYSLQRRIEKSRKRGEVFRLGPYAFEDHPWGVMLTELPDTYEGVLVMMSELDHRAWTLDPSYLQTKFRKSISELWADIRSEISDLSEYIHTVYDGLAEDQEDALELRRSDNVLVATAGIDPIPIDSVGYIPPSRLPVKQLTVDTGDKIIQVSTEAGTYTSVDQNDNAADDLDELEDLEDEPREIVPGSAQVMEAGEIERIEQKYLTYRYLWHVLSLPEVPDASIRLGFGLPDGYDLDTEHIDAAYGPTVTEGEESKAVRQWARKRNLMMNRAGIAVTVITEDDM